jgi:hypothetical protein
MRQEDLNGSLGFLMRTCFKKVTKIAEIGSSHYLNG